MTSTIDATTSTSGDILDELRSWLEDNWDPDLTVAEWWERLGRAGWAAPTLPTNASAGAWPVASGSRSLRSSSRRARAPAGLGLLLAAPTIADHGTESRSTPWCATSSPGRRRGASSSASLVPVRTWPGLTTKAVHDGDEWVVTGQKVWTSLGQIADIGC